MSDDVPWLLTALPRERRAFRHRPVASVCGPPSPAWSCRGGKTSYLLGEVGVGGANVVAALDRWLTDRRPAFVVLAGFAGALRDGLSVGDGLIVSSVVAPDGRTFAASHPLALPYPAGSLLTSDHLVGDPDEKRRLAESLKVDAVDMETAYLAEWCMTRGIPWAGVRVISDDVRAPVSKAVFDLLESGRIPIPRLTAAIVRQPSLIAELLRLERATRRASHVIANAFERVLERPTPR